MSTSKDRFEGLKALGFEGEAEEISRKEMLKKTAGKIIETTCRTSQSGTSSFVFCVLPQGSFVLLRPVPFSFRNSLTLCD
jgi:hypothetical protein